MCQSPGIYLPIISEHKVASLAKFKCVCLGCLSAGYWQTKTTTRQLSFLRKRGMHISELKKKKKAFPFLVNQLGSSQEILQRQHHNHHSYFWYQQEI